MTELHPVRLGLAVGVWFALYVLFMGAVALTTGWGRPIIDIISLWYPGSGFNPAGIVIGSIWGLVDGLVGGILIAVIYNNIPVE